MAPNWSLLTISGPGSQTKEAPTTTRLVQTPVNNEEGVISRSPQGMPNLVVYCPPYLHRECPSWHHPFRTAMPSHCASESSAHTKAVQPGMKTLS